MTVQYRLRQIARVNADTRSNPYDLVSSVAPILNTTDSTVLIYTNQAVYYWTKDPVLPRAVTALLPRHILKSGYIAHLSRGIITRRAWSTDF